MRSHENHERVLNEIVDKMLAHYGEVLIIDCHSFSDTPFKRDSNQKPNRADICLGTTPHNTNEKLIENYRNGFEKHGLSVVINSPYSGSMLPLHHQGNGKVQTIMIEINRKLYMDNGVVDDKRVKELNSLINSVIQSKIY